MSGINFSETLNDEQRAAVLAPDGPVLVIAAAGTGKTRTLTFRVAHLVERGINAQRILLLTFTNRAAREMLERARGLVGEGVSGLWGGTFHHMANRMLRRHCEALGYKPDYTILDQDDARSLVRACADELDLLGKHFPKPDVLLSVYSLAANKEAPVEVTAGAHFGTHRINIEDVVKVHARYVERKRTLNAMDFDDLLVNGLRLFREQPDVLERYQEHFLHILVDEYQDTNTIQAEWVDRLAANRRNLLVVGDDFQSIYSWRGADFRNILGFPKRYPDATVFKLETNYRSVPGILEVANACIAGNPEQFQKTLRAVREDGQKPVLVSVRGGEEQASYIIERAQSLVREGYRMSDIAVLYRAHYHALELQLELARQRIPFDITSGVRFFEQAHIKDVCSLLRVLVNPGDELGFVRLLGMFPKTGPRTAARIWESLDHRCDLKDQRVTEIVRDKLPQASRAAWKNIVEICRAYVKEQLNEDPGEVIYRFINAFYDDYAVETFENYERRREDLDALIDFTTKYTSAEELLADAALMSNLDAETDEIRGSDEHALRLSTIHQAKGLEWRIVFVIWLADGMFPSSRAINEGGEGEERRLFYVATTRARDQLYLCSPQLRRSRDGGAMFCLPSRFIKEVPCELLDSEDLGFM